MTTEAEAVAALATKAARAPDLLEDTDTGRTWLTLPAGTSVQEVSDEWGMKVKAPKRIGQAIALTEKQSFIDYLNRFKNDSTIVVCDFNQNLFKAVLDYHLPDAPAFKAHTATFSLQLAEEWQRWTGIDKQLKPQDEFARFIEENVPDIAKPNGADLLELARDMSAKRAVTWRRAVRAANGDESFEFTEDTLATGGKGKIDVPTDFTLMIPIFFNEKPTELKAFLRWRLNQGLVLGIELHRREFVRQAVLRLIATEIAEKTKCMVLYGTITT